MLDLSRVVPEAQPVVEKAALVYMHHTARHFEGLLAHGSAVKGGWVPGVSDIDLQLYLKPAAFQPDGNLPFELTVAIHRDLARIDPAPFQYIQCYAFGGIVRAGWTGPIPGTYTVLAGRLPVAEATAEELRASAHDMLAGLDPVPRYLKDGLLDHGRWRLAHRLRWLTTEVWPALYALHIVRGAEPIATWNLTKQQAMAALPADSPERKLIESFYDALVRYFPEITDPGTALDALVHGTNFLAAARGAAR
jgi:hypothetical protein